MESFDDIEAAAHHQFRDGDYLLTISTHNSKSLKIQVEDESTGEQWLGKFDSAYIEELTHKTGNFKEFNIFCSMLESGISKTSESITLDLMTYSDLEALRNKKVGGSKRRDASSNKAMNNKRYLIVTYTVEFDRIHYPLSLNYVGKFDPFAMRKLIKQQREEIRDLKLRLQNAHNSSTRNTHDSSYERLLQEKEAISSELEMCRRFLASNSVAKELRILKKVISSLESDLLKERSKHQRVLFKKSDECKRLADELEDVKASERNLKLRVKSLTEEISITKKSLQNSPQMKIPIYASRWSRKATAYRSRSNSKDRGANSSMERKYTTPSPSGSRRFDPTAYIEEKKRKQIESARRSRPGLRALPRSRSASLERISSQRLHSSQSKDRPPSRRTSSSRDLRRRPMSRSSSVGSVGSRNSSVDSGKGRTSSLKKRRTPSTLNRERRGLGSISKKETRKSILRSVISSGESETENSYRKNASSYKSRGGSSKRGSKHRFQNDKDTEVDNEDDERLDKSLDIAEIDARLSALQMFMKSNLDEM